MIESSLPFDLPPAHAQANSAHADVLAPGVFRVEAGAQFQDGGNFAVDAHAAGGAVERAGQDLQQGALARPIAADHAHHLPAPNVEVDVLQRPKFFMARLAGDHLPEHVGRPAVDLVHLGEIADLDDRLGGLRFPRRGDAVNEYFAVNTHHISGG